MNTLKLKNCSINSTPRNHRCLTTIKCTLNEQQRIATRTTHDRRSVLYLSGVASLAALSLGDGAKAAKLPSGFKAQVDKSDGYQFLYPTEWQSVTVSNEDVVFKDIIEPLESVGVTLAPTDKSSIKDFGELNEVAYTLVDTVLTSPEQKVDLIATAERELEGIVYYQFEFVVSTKYFVRHALATVAVGNGQFYALVTGANEKRWPKIEERLRTVIKSFQIKKPDLTPAV